MPTVREMAHGIAACIPGWSDDARFRFAELAALLHEIKPLTPSNTNCVASQEEDA